MSTLVGDPWPWSGNIITYPDQNQSYNPYQWIQWSPAKQIVAMDNVTVELAENGWVFIKGGKKWIAPTADEIPDILKQIFKEALESRK